jgi:hypothetical protein
LEIYTTTIAISIVIYIAIGNYAGRGIKRPDDYDVHDVLGLSRRLENRGTVTLTPGS